MLNDTDIREKLVAIWHDLTGQTAVDSSSLSKLGAGSMANLMLKKKIHQVFALDVKVAELFKHAQFASQLALLKQHMSQQPASTTDNMAENIAEQRIEITADAVERPVAFDLPWLAQCRDKFQLPGINISLYKDGLHGHLASGFDDAAIAQTPLTVDHRYRLYCTGKVLLAYTVLRLVAQQKMGLDQPVNEVVPGLFSRQSDSEMNDQITLRILLSHTVGLDETVLNPVIDKASGLQQVVAQMTHFEQITRPGELFIYSSCSFIIVAYIIECLSGLDWKAAMDQLLFQPLGITEGMDSSLDKLAQGYAKGGDLSELSLIDEAQVNHLAEYFDMVASTKIALTSESLLKLAVIPLLGGKTLEGETFLSAELAGELVTMQTSIEGHFYLLGWGLGWFAYADEGVFGFLSGTNGHHTAVVIDSLKCQAMVAQTNTSQNHEFFNYLAQQLMGVNLLKTDSCFPAFELNACYGEYRANGMEVTISQDPQVQTITQVKARFMTLQGRWSEFIYGQVVPSGKGDYMVKPKVSPVHGSLSFHDFGGTGEVSHLRISQRLCRKVSEKVS